MLVTFVSILVNFVISRFTPMIYLLLVLVCGILAIINSIIHKEEMYILRSFKGTMDVKEKVVKVAIIILLAIITIAGILGILSGLDKGLF